MSLKYLNKKQFSKERLYCIVDNPVITERATLEAEKNKYVFKVAKGASKFEIKQAVSKIFGVDVVAVNTSVVKGKTKRFKGVLGKRANWKKAVVSLKSGQSIDIGSNV